jgi:transcriptional regulator with XRE-family HTH domain
VDELDAELAGRLRSALDERGWRREDMAREMTNLGFKWTGNTVTQVITGRRGLSLLELAGVCEALGQPVPGLIDPDAKFQLPSGDTIGIAPVILALAMRTGDWTKLMATKSQIKQSRAEVQRLMNEEATYKAASRLGVEPALVVEAAQQHWGHSLGAEREKRIGADFADVDAPDQRRALQARRGHVTRALIEELRTYLAERQR